MKSKLILLQRTTLDSETALYKILKIVTRNFPSLSGTAMSIRAVVNKELILKNYLKEMESDYTTIAPFLPKVAAPIVIDIGAGMAGINVFLDKHYMNKGKFILIDENRVDDHIHYGYQPTGSIYNENTIVRSFLSNYNIIPTQLAPSDLKDIQTKADIVITLYSWGFHYPIETYLESVKRILKNDGILIMDVRKIPDWENKLVGFKIEAIAMEDNKFARIIAKKI
jgi:SAM-dependent methyltransferase